MNEGKNNKEGIDFSGSLRDDSGTGVKFQEYRKNKKQASYVLLGLAALAIIIFLIVVLGGGSGQPTQGPVPVDQFVP